ncbi:unnamed protein product, partial [Lymnaea stagnalis]
MGYVKSRILFQMLCVGTFVLRISNGCQMSSSSDQCQQGWYQVEHKCIFLPNTSVRTHVDADEGCKILGGKLLSLPISAQVKECILSLNIGESSTEIWIDKFGRKSQLCGTISLPSEERSTVTCNEKVTTPRSYACESNSSPHQTTPKETDCPVGFERIHRGCYKFVQGEQGELDWNKAFNYCKQSNSALSEIISPSERDDVQKHLASRYPSIQSWWMGLKREEHTEWAWLDGTAVDPNMIPWNNPALRTMNKELCGTIETKDLKFLISGAKCSRTNPFICEYHAITPRPAVSATTPEMPIQESGANTDIVSFTTLNREETEVSTTNPASWIAIVTTTATPIADVEAPTASEVSEPPTAEVSGPPTAEVSAPPTADVSAPPTAAVSGPPTAEASGPPTAE